MHACMLHYCKHHNAYKLTLRHASLCQMCLKMSLPDNFCEAISGYLEKTSSTPSPNDSKLLPVSGGSN